MSVELERCWLCTLILPKASNPPDVAPDDLCRCLEVEEVSGEERFRELEERIEKLEER